MALSDQDVQKQINQMIAFIDQEASEKCEEIEAKAEEEFNIEKGRLVQQQRVKIMEYYNRREKQVDLAKKIQNSNLMNAARLKVLKAQEDHISIMLDEAKKRMSEVTQDKSKYKTLLQNLLTQCFCQITEKVLLVRVRKQDESLVKEVVPSAVAEYKKLTGKDLQCKLDSENPLSSQLIGGVECVTPNGKIRITNTLEKRLQFIADQMVPELRVMLFGRNPNRKFDD